MSYPKPIIRVLEKCFAAEVDGRLPAQLGRGGQQGTGPVARALDEGLIRPFDRRMAFNDGLPPMMIRGFALTTAGHLVYCEWAAKQPQPDEPS